MVNPSNIFIGCVTATRVVLDEDRLAMPPGNVAVAQWTDLSPAAKKRKIDESYQKVGPERFVEIIIEREPLCMVDNNGFVKAGWYEHYKDDKAMLTVMIAKDTVALGELQATYATARQEAKDAQQAVTTATEDVAAREAAVANAVTQFRQNVEQFIDNPQPAANFLNDRIAALIAAKASLRAAQETLEGSEDDHSEAIKRAKNLGSVVCNRKKALEGRTGQVDAMP